MTLSSGFGRLAPACREVSVMIAISGVGVGRVAISGASVIGDGGLRR